MAPAKNSAGLVPAHSHMLLENSNGTRHFFSIARKGQDAWVVDEFGPYLRSLLQEAGLSITQFAARVGKSQGAISQALNGDVRPPLRDMSSWADALRLSSADRTRLTRAALVAQAPGLLDYVRSLESRSDLVELEKEIDTLRDHNRQLRLELERVTEIVTDLEAELSALKGTG